MYRSSLLLGRLFSRVLSLGQLYRVALCFPLGEGTAFHGGPIAGVVSNLYFGAELTVIGYFCFVVGGCVVGHGGAREGSHSDGQ